MTPNDEVLNSWKEVASYLGRGVRTVQRWEQELGLPVRRPRGKSRSAVIAFKSELDNWLHHAPAENLNNHEGHSEEKAPAVPPLKYSRSERQVKLHENTALLLDKTHLLLSRSNSLCEQLKTLQERVQKTAQLTTLNVQRNAKHLSVVVAAAPPPGNGQTASRAQSAAQASSHSKLAS
jgi:phage terminase Nu1 subunit (DNA packaging protein)